MPSKQRTKRAANWTEVETLALLQIRKDPEMRVNVIEISENKKKIWGNMATLLHDEGFPERSPVQIHTKVKDLRALHRRRCWCQNFIPFIKNWSSMHNYRTIRSSNFFHATCHFNSEFAINGINNVADVRITFPSLNDHAQCLLIWQFIQARAQIFVSNISTYVDDNQSQKYRLTIEYSMQIFYNTGMSNGIAYAADDQ